MELIDVLHADGTPAGYTASKKEVHEKGLWHRASHVWFVNNQKEILLQKRAAHVVNHPGYYDISAAGHLTAGDTALEGAVRETHEELGIKLDPSRFIKIGTVTQTSHRERYINKEHNDVYLVTGDFHDDDFIIDPEEVALMQWISIDTLQHWVATEKDDLVPHPDEYKILFAYLESNDTT